MNTQGDIDPTWTGNTPTSPVPAHIPADEHATSLPLPIRPRRWLAVLGIGSLFAVLGGLFFASEAGWVTLGIERWWGASNRPQEALADAGAALSTASRYRAHGELTLRWETPPMLPMLEGTMTNEVETTTEGAGAVTALTVRFVQQTGPEGALFETEWLPSASVSAAARLAPFFGHNQIRLDIFVTDADLYLRQPAGKDGGWVQVGRQELSTLGASEATWTELIAAIASGVTGGERTLGRTLDGVRVKGYEATTQPTNIVQAILPNVRNTDGVLTLEPVYVGRADRRPYAVTLTGNVGATAVEGTIVFRDFDGAVVVTPPAGTIARASLGDWLVAQGLIARTPAAARDAQRVSDLGRLKDALAHYATEEHPYRYPKVDGVIRLDGSSELTTALQAILGTVPTDPLSPARYYGYSSDGATYRLTAVLEDRDHPSGMQDGELTLLAVTP